MKTLSKPTATSLFVGGVIAIGISVAPPQIDRAEAAEEGQTTNSVIGARASGGAMGDGDATTGTRKVENSGVGAVPETRTTADANADVDVEGHTTMRSMSGGAIGDGDAATGTNAATSTTVGAGSMGADADVNAGSSMSVTSDPAKISTETTVEGGASAR
ncbi:MAG: hypothetical protein JJ899_10715 [Alphaproteobacteria bacterium]|nr:hypothetical protein [Alphaproteobacteria bacterium]